MKKSDMKICELYSLEHTMAKPLLEEYEYPWEVLPRIGEFIRKLGESLPKTEYDNPMEGIWIHKTAKGCSYGRHYSAGDHRSGS